MDEFEDLAQSGVANDTIINNLQEISQQNTLVIQNLVNEVSIIKRNT